MKKIAFIVGTLNEEKHIGECIDSVNRDKYKNKEVIIVDGGSRDRTIEIAKKKGATVLIEEGERKCPANSWNQAIRYTDADLICLLGADFTLSDEEFCEKVVKCFDDPNVVCVYTNVRTIEDTLVEKIVSKAGKSIHPNVFRRDTTLKVGGFPIIGFSEDRIFNIRFMKYMERTGTRAIFLDNTHYSGHAVHTLKALFKQWRWYGRTSIIYLKEFYKETNIFQTLKEILSVNFKMIYLSLFLLSLVLFNTEFFYYFFIPFSALVFLIIAKNITTPLRTLKIFTNIVSGAGFFVGLASYISGLDRNRGRG